MKLIVWTLLLSVGIITGAKAQTFDLNNIYNPAADAKADIEAAKQKALKENKHILLQIGGNWCIWCKRFYKFTEDDPELKAALEKGFVVYHLNYSKENRNLPILASLGYPQRFGFPVLVVLDAKGNRLHTQNSGLLESADTYDKKKVGDFLKQWSPDALNPAHYINQ